MANINDHLVLLCGKSATGKSMCLRGIPNPEGVMYLNCEAGKKLPFKAKFQQHVITEPLQIYEAFDYAEGDKSLHTIVIDSSTYLMDMYETMYVYKSANTQSAWGDYAHYFRTLMQDKVAKSSKKVVFIAHTLDSLNEVEMAMETKVPIKGALKNNGVESFFSVVIGTKKVALKYLKDYVSPLLTITPEEEALGLKYVIQTKITKETIGERLRSPMDLFQTKETFIDNNVQLVLDRLDQYYS